MQRRRAMAGQIDVVRVAQRRDPQEAGDAAATRASACSTSTAPASSIRAEIVGRVAIFAGRDLHRRPARARARAAGPSRSSEETGSSNQATLLARSARPMPSACLPRRRRSRRRTERGVADRALARPRRGRDPARARLPIFIFTQRQPSRSTQPASCSRSSLVAVAGEAAAAIDRRRRRASPEQRASGSAEQLRLQVPERASTAEIAVAASPARPRLRTARRIAAPAPAMSIASAPSTASASVALDQRGDRRDRIGVADPGLAAGLDLHDHQRRAVPRECAVGLGLVGRNV